MNWTKKKIENSIIEALLGIELTKQILETVKEFEHHVHVNKRFTDKMKEVGCYAFIIKDNYSTTLSISKGEDYGKPKAEFRLYVSHVMSKSDLTWDRIKDELARYDFDKRLKDAKERLELIEKEREEAKELLKMIKSKNFKCFDFSQRTYEIENAINEALN